VITSFLKRRRGNAIREGRFSALFDIFNALFMIILCVSILLPFWMLLVQSLDSTNRTIGTMRFWPESFTLKFYSKVVHSRFIWIGYGNTLFSVIVGCVLALFLTSMGAFAISKKYFPHRTFWTFYMLLTMFFSGGLIPTYLWFSRLGFIDNRLEYILPSSIGIYNLVMIRNYIYTIPAEMEESARLDGAGDFKIYWYIILPMSKPILATVALWIIVYKWNAWFDCLVYMRTTNKQVLQVVLRRIINEGSNEMLEGASVRDMATNPDMLKAASIYVSTLPVLIVYPFIQKYFVKGIYVGSLKG
jgi:putative aldouronate transport system permease protein